VTFGNGVTTGTINGTSTTTGTGAGAGGVPSHPEGLAGASNLTSVVTSLLTSIGAGGISANTARGFSPATAFLNADGVHAVLSFLNSDAQTESISLPRTVALDGVPTELAVVRNIPVFIQQQAPGGAGQNNLVTVTPNYDLEIKDTGGTGNALLNEVGVKLKVTPRIVGGTNVFMDLKPEVSQRETGTEKVTINGSTSESPIFNRRKIITQATVPSGYTLVLGGMSSDQINKNYTKVPGFGDLPLLGALFRSNTKEHLKTTILIFVTPTIIQDTDFQMAHGTFLKTKDVPRPELDETPWDSGKPIDWTKPKTKVDPYYDSK
jgi:general secretion pathway protein D